VLVLFSRYLGYEVTRNVGRSSAARALANADSLLALQESLGLSLERALQRAALPHRWLIEAADAYYGLVYVVATLSTLVWLSRVAPRRYRFWRNALLISTTLGLIVTANHDILDIVAAALVTALGIAVARYVWVSRSSADRD